MNMARTQLADLLKGIAVVLMIQVHIIEKFAVVSIYESNVGKLLLFLGGPPVAPIFMVVMGFYLAASKKSPKQLLFRGFLTFSAGMLLNILINLNLFISINKGIYILNPLPYLFGVDILQFAGLSICLITIIKPLIDKSLFIAVGLIVVIAMSGQILQEHLPKNEVLKYLSAIFYGSTEFSYFPLLPWFAYPVLGVVFYRVNQLLQPSILNNKKINLLISSFFGLFMIVSWQYGVSNSSNLPTYYHQSFQFMMWVIVFVFGYGFLINSADILFGKTQLLLCLKWLGKNVTVIYFVQWIIVGNLTTEIYRTVSSPIALTLYFTIILFVSSAVAFIFNKINVNKQTSHSC